MPTLQSVQFNFSSRYGEISVIFTEDEYTVLRFGLPPFVFTPYDFKTPIKWGRKDALRLIKLAEQNPNK